MLCSVARGGQFVGKSPATRRADRRTLSWADKKAMSRRVLRRLMAWGSGGSDRRGSGVRGQGEARRARWNLDLDINHGARLLSIRSRLSKAQTVYTRQGVICQIIGGAFSSSRCGCKRRRPERSPGVFWPGRSRRRPKRSHQGRILRLRSEKPAASLRMLRHISNCWGLRDHPSRRIAMMRVRWPVSCADTAAIRFASQCIRASVGGNSVRSTTRKPKQA